MISEKPVQRRHKGGPGIGAGHLDADDGPRILRAEIVRRGVDDAGVDGGASKADDDKPGEGDSRLRRGEQQQEDPAGQHAGPQTDHVPVAQPVRHEAAQKPARGDADVKQRSEPGRALRPDALDLHHVCAGPAHGGGLGGAVGEKAEQQGRDAPDPQRAQQPDGFSALLRLLPVDVPDGERDQQEQGDAQLDKAHDTVAVVPDGVRQGIAHDEGADDGPNTPEAVQPAHMPGGVVKGDIFVQRRVDGSGSQPVGDGKHNEHPEPAGDGKPQQGDRREEYAGHGHDAGAQLPSQPV